MIKKIIDKLFYNPYKFVSKHKDVITIGETILTKAFRIRFDEKKNNKIKIGNGCVLSCEIIFEKETGEVLIGDNTFIGGNTQLISINSIKVGNNVQISWGVTIYDHNGNSLNHLDRRVDSTNIYKNYHSQNMLKEFNWKNIRNAPIVVEDDVWIGFGSTILKGVTIGKGAIVGAQSVVTKNVEPFTIVMGNPAQKIKEIR